MILGYVKGQDLTLAKSYVVGNTIDYLTARFLFQTQEWNDMIVYAHFEQGEDSYIFVLENGEISADRHLNLSDGDWSVWLHGNDFDGVTRLTTDKASFKVIPTGGADGVLPEMPIEVAEQIGAMAGQALETAKEAKEQAEASLLNAERAEAAAENAERSADDAELSASNAKISETNAKDSETQSNQNLFDLLAMLGNAIPTLVDGKIPLSQIPATATQEVYVVSSEEELTSLTAQRGDIAELLENINGEQTITKVWQCLGDSTVRSNWVVWGVSYAVQAGNATLAESAANSERINGMRLVTMNLSDFENAVKDPDTLYGVDMGA